MTRKHAEKYMERLASVNAHMAKVHNITNNKEQGK